MQMPNLFERRRQNIIHGNTGHATMINRTMAKSARRAGNRTADHSLLLSKWSGPYWIGRTENANRRDSQGIRHVHRTGIIGNKNGTTFKNHHELTDRRLA